MRSSATPIRPDLNQILSQPQESAQFPLARAGWDGPEQPRSPDAAPNPTLERIGPAASARGVRESLKSAAIPDFRAIAGILLVILLLRRMRTQKKAELKKAPRSPDRAELSRAA